MNEPTQLMSPEDMKSLAEHAAKSGMFGIQNSSQAFCLFAICSAEGLHPVTALKRYHIIEGKPSMRADAMLAEFIAKGGGALWHIRSDTSVAATFFADAKAMDAKAIERAKARYLALISGNFKGASDQAHPSEDTIVRTIADADSKGLSMCWKKGDDGKFKRERKTNWAQSPRQMLTARVITEGVRLIAPGIVAGVSSPEDIEDSKEDRNQFVAEVLTDSPATDETIAALRDEYDKVQARIGAASKEEREPLFALRTALSIKIQDYELTQAQGGPLPALTNEQLGVKAIATDIPDDIPMEHPSKAAIPADCKLVKGSEVRQPEKKKPESDSPFSEPDRQKADEARNPTSPAEPAAASDAGSGATEPFPTNPRDYKIRFIPAYAGRPLGSLSNLEMNVILKCKTLARLAASKDWRESTEAQMIQAMAKGGK